MTRRRRRGLSLMAGLVFLGILLPASSSSAAPAAPDQAITEFRIPTPQSAPYGLTVGKDGLVWFAESDGDKVGRISPGGSFQEYPTLPDASPRELTLGPDGSVWFTELSGGMIGQLAPTGHMHHYPVPTGFADPLGIAAAPDGTIWFTESNEANQIGILFPPLGYIEEIHMDGDLRPSFIAAGPDGAMWFTGELGNEIGRVTIPDREVTFYPVPTPSALPWDIVAGPDGAMWFTELAGRNIGRISMDGTITEYPVPVGFGSITGITVGFDGDLWFTQTDDGTVGRMTTSGQLLGFVHPGGGPNAIAAGADGNLWVTQRGANRIARISAAPRGTASVFAADAGFIRRAVTIPLGGRVRWQFLGPNPHSVTDDLGFFDTGPEPVGVVQPVAYQWAGTFSYHDASNPASTGQVEVGLDLPEAGSIGEPFPVTWAIKDAPFGFVFDVRVLTPGSSAWSTWQDGVPALTADYTASEAGTYSFESRIRDSDGSLRSRWSPIRSVEVSGDGAREGRAFWSSHGYLVPDPARYERLKLAATASAAAGGGNLPPVGTGIDPVPGPSFRGLNDPDVSPPDPTGAIGPNSYVEMINLQIGIYDRAGALIANAPISDLVGGNQIHYSDPQVIWDPHTQRFYYLIWDYTSATFRWGFSKTGDPRTLDSTSFCSYISGFGYSPFDAPDYPKLGQTKDFLLIGVNFFKGWTEYLGGDLLWIKKPTSPDPITTCPTSQPMTGRFKALRDQYGNLMDAPEPAVQVDPSSIGHVVAIPFNLTGDGDSLTLFTVRKNPQTGKPILSEGRTIAVPAYSYPSYAPQCGSPYTLDTLDDRFLHAVSALDPTTGKIEVWTAHAVFGGAGSEVRWYEITPTRGDPVIAQSGTVNDPTLYVWNGGISPDRTVSPTGRAHGDAMVLTFSTSSPSDCPAAAMVSKIGSGPQSGIVTVHRSPKDLLDQTCVPICRWGDYSGALPDPAAALDAAHGRVWLVNQIALDDNGAGTWVWGADP
jgi:streptogramin lyase